MLVIPRYEGSGPCSLRNFEKERKTTSLQEIPPAAIYQIFLLLNSKSRIHFSNELHFLLPSPCFDFIFSCYGIIYILMWFKPEKEVNVVLTGKRSSLFPLLKVFDDPLLQVICHPNIKNGFELLVSM